MYISSNETIALPILEAKRYNLFIIAPKLPYSEQFIKPDLSFDFNIKDDLSNCIEKSLQNNFNSTKQIEEYYNFSSNITINNFLKNFMKYIFIFSKHFWPENFKINDIVFKLKKI